jgi:preprotein translocase subunit SecF
MKMRIIGDTHFDFLSKRKIAFTCSGILVAIGLFAVVMLTLGKGNVGIQFTGGTSVEGYFAQPVDVGQIRQALSQAGYADAEIVQITGRTQPYTFLVQVKAEGDATQKAQSVVSALKQYFPNNAFTTDSIHEVGSAVGKTLQSQTRWAVIISLIGIMIYITVRFDFRFGVAATIATFHDVLAMMGIFYLLRIEITILVVSAVLTIAGWSLTDTVIVYDRIRENLKKFHRKADFPLAVNNSINEVLARTIMTGITTLVTVVALLIFGGPVLRDFSFALIVGITIGTYSSWFVASPIYVEWENRSPKRYRSS